MSITKLLISAIVGGIVFFLLRWLIYGHLLMNFMYHYPGKAGHVIFRRQMVLIYIIASSLLQGLLISYVVIKGNINTLLAGLITGCIIGFLVTASIDTLIYATSIMLSKKGMVADILGYTVIYAIAGAVISVMTGGNKKTT